MNEVKQSERQDRLVKLNKIKELKLNPYPAKNSRSQMVGEALADFPKLEQSQQELTIAGRLRSMREHGNIAFADLEDASGRLQLVLSKTVIGAEDYKNFIKLIDTSDFIEATGFCFVTKAGQQSLQVKSWRLLAKALRSLPDEHFGLKNEEEKLRKRYLDILLNPEVKDMIIKKDKFWNAVRSFLKSKNFIEVETPALETNPGGADARPFVTHHHALDLDVYLRISMGELWQKKLMVAGLEKTFEIGRQFRNEGMDAEHLQDYTQMEFYWAYADYEAGMALVEEMYKYVAQATFGTLQFTIGKFEVDLSQPWERYDYIATVKKYTDIDITTASLETMVAKLQELKIEYDTKGFNITRAIDNLWKYCRRQIKGPGFLVGVPVTVSPLAKRDDANPKITQRFQPIIAGSELGNGYSELNDPVDQAERFQEQQALREAGDEEAQRKDDEFVEALEYGMPPTCGYGMSERVFSFLMNKTSRECQIFPLLRPKDQAETSGNKNTVKVVVSKPTKAVEEPTGKLGLDQAEAEELLHKYITDANTLKHCRATAVIMQALAKQLQQDAEAWGIIGLLHDIDWELTKADPSQHCVKAVDILKQAGASQFLINSVISHCYGHPQISAYADKERSGQLQHLLAAAETITGLIVATALVRPDKKLVEVELSSLQKKYKTPSFAANCSRQIIMECEQADLPLEEFMKISLEAMKTIANDLGL
ncbi:MAG: lysine--tRNA ligase [bacterium]